MRYIMKKINLFLAIFLIVSVFTVSLAACGKKNNGKSDDGTSSNQSEETYVPIEELPDPVAKYTKSRVPDAVCSYDVGETSYEIIKNGSGNGYTIVYPSAGDQLLKFAATEIRNFIAEATGVYLTVKTDAEFAGTAKIISLGNTVQRKANLNVTGKLSSVTLKDSGFMLYTYSDSLYIMGNTGSAVLWGAYEFLHLELNYEYFAFDCYTLDKGVKNLTLKKLDVVDVPDIQYRISGNGADYLDSTHMRRMKYNSYSDFYNLTKMAYMHNYFDIIPKETYSADHPEWFSTDGTQLCFTRDPDGLEQEVFKELKWRILADETRDYIPFHLNDGGGWCSCAKCRENDDRYDNSTISDTANVLLFMNKLGKDIKEWNRTEPALAGRNLKLVFISYGHITAPPLKTDANKNPVKDEQGNYIPYSEEYVLEDNVIVQLACFGGDVMDVGGNDQANFYSEIGRNETSIDRINKWKAVTNQFLFWVYSAMFSNYMSPFEVAGTRADTYKILYNNGALLVFDNSRYDTPYSSDWGVFEDYIYSQSMWNVNADFDELKQKFFKNYFGIAANTMLSFYDDYRSYMYYLYFEKNQVYYIHGASEYTNRNNYPLGKIKYYLSFIDRAYRDIESLKNNSAEYDKYYTRILRESITWRYLEEYLFPETFSSDMYAEVRKQLLKDCYKCGITTGVEHGTIADMFN